MLFVGLIADGGWAHNGRMPADCPRHCVTSKTQFGLIPPTPSFLGSVGGYFGLTTPLPLLNDVKDYLDAIAEAGRFRIDVSGRPRRQAFSFLCQFRAGTRMYHGTPSNFSDLGRNTVLRGGFYTTWREYAELLLWKGLLEPTCQTRPEDAVIFDFPAPAGDFLFVNSRLYTGYVIGDARQSHNVVLTTTYADDQFSRARNFAQHAKIFCNSVANYGVAGLQGVIQGVSANAMDVQGLLDPLLKQGPLAPETLGQRQRHFNDLCQAIGGTRGPALAQQYAVAVPHTLNAVSPDAIAEFEELYWNSRPTPSRTHRLHGDAEDGPVRVAPVRRNSSPNLLAKPSSGTTRGPVNRLERFRAQLVELLRTDYLGHQYCFDYRTYGPLLTTRDPQGLPSPVTARSCLTPLRRSKAELDALCTSLFDRLRAECGNGIKAALYDLVRGLVDRSSQGALSAQDIETLRDGARRLRALL